MLPLKMIIRKLDLYDSICIYFFLWINLIYVSYKKIFSIALSVNLGIAF